MSFFEIIKTYIDQFDHMGLLKMGAPKDEYDIESRMINDLITNESTVEDIAEIISQVFSNMFDIKQQKDFYVPCAEMIFKDVNG